MQVRQGTTHRLSLVGGGSFRARQAASIDGPRPADSPQRLAFACAGRLAQQDAQRVLLRSVPALAIVCFIVTLGLISPTAHAFDYSVTISVKTEDDIYELVSSGDITEEEAARLVAVFQTKINLNRATAEELYVLPDVSVELSRAIVADREAQGRFNAPRELSRVAGMTPAILQQALPFIVARPSVLNQFAPITGTLTIKGAWSYDAGLEVTPLEEAELGRSYRVRDLGLDTLPEGYLQFRGAMGSRLEVGLLATSSEDISKFQFDEANQRFQATWGRPLLALRKVYARIEEKEWEAILGTYTIGFGQKLVFDESGRYNPNGFYGDDQANSASNFPSVRQYFSYTQELFGLAATYNGIELGPTTVELTGFYSRRPYDLGQYELALPAREANDTSNVVMLGDAALYGVILPNFYQEQIAGSHVTFRLDKRTYVGATAYYANVIKPFEFTFTSDLPSSRDAFGAAGLDFGAALWRFQLNGEYAVMDNRSQAAFLRSVLDIPNGEILVSLRAYGRDFDNPHSSGFSDVDVLERERDRDEMGAYFKGAYRFNRYLTTRLSYNIWYRSSLEVWRNEIFGQLIVNPSRAWKFDLWGLTKDKNLALDGRNRSYESGTTGTLGGLTLQDDATDSTVVVDDDDEPDGTKTQLGLRMTSKAIRDLTVQGSYRRLYEDSARTYYTRECLIEYDWQVGQDVWVKLSGRPFAGSQATVRMRYMDEDVYGSKGIRAYETYVQWSQRVGRFDATLRYTIGRDMGGHTQGVNNYCESLGDTTSAEDTTEVVTEEVFKPIHALWFTFSTKF